MLLKQSSFAGRIATVLYYYDKGQVSKPIALYRTIMAASV
jgi:hypothetical protein